MSFHHSPKIVTDGLSVYLDAANRKSYSGTGTSWLNLVSNTANGILTNNPTFNSANGGIITFNGVNNYVALTLPTFSSTFSISFWVKITTLVANSEIQLLGSPSDTASISTLGSTTSTIRFLSWNGSNARFANPYIIQNKWYNLVLVNGSDTRYYIDGAFDSFSATTATLNSGAAIIGAINGSSRFLTGNIATVSFYNKALSGSEILQNYNALKGRFNL
jgi:hypothetical protein